jgi:hypothetical protein
MPVFFFTGRFISAMLMCRKLTGGNMRLYIFMLMLITASFLSCGGGETGGTKTNGVTAPQTIEEGWLSDTEFRVKVSAEADSTATDSDTLKKASENAAIKKAKEAVVKNFVIIRVKQSPSAGSYAVAAMAIDREFRDTIEHGKIIFKQYDMNDRRCTMIYQVERKDLKKAVEQGAK